MLKQLQKIKDQLAALEEKAAQYRDGDSEKTSDKYANVPDHIQGAVDALEEAISELEEAE